MVKNKIVGITGIDTRKFPTNFIRDKGAPKGTISFTTKKLNIKKLIKITNKWSGLKDLDLAKRLQLRKIITWQDFKTWNKEDGFKKNNKNSYHVVAIDYGIKNILRYFSDFNCKVTVVPCKQLLKIF